MAIFVSAQSVVFDMGHAIYVAIEARTIFLQDKTTRRLVPDTSLLALFVLLTTIFIIIRQIGVLRIAPVAEAPSFASRVTLPRPHENGSVLPRSPLKPVLA